MEEITGKGKVRLEKQLHIDDEVARDEKTYIKFGSFTSNNFECYFRNRVRNMKGDNQHIGIHASTSIENQQPDENCEGLLFFYLPRATFLRQSKASNINFFQT